MFTEEQKAIVNQAQKSAKEAALQVESDPGNPEVIGAAVHGLADVVVTLCNLMGAADQTPEAPAENAGTEESAGEGEGDGTTDEAE